MFIKLKSCSTTSSVKRDGVLLSFNILDDNRDRFRFEFKIPHSLRPRDNVKVLINTDTTLWFTSVEQISGGWKRGQQSYKRRRKNNNLSHRGLYEFFRVEKKREVENLGIYSTFKVKLEPRLAVFSHKAFTVELFFDPDRVPRRL